MRNLVLQVSISLDGYIEDKQRNIDWHFADEEFAEFIDTTLRSIDAMIFGRAAFERLADYWPTAGSDPNASPEQVRLMAELPKYVVSTTLKCTAWQNSHVISGNVGSEIQRLKEEPGRDIALFAGASLAMSVLRLGLIDELRLIVSPVLLGGGTRLFHGEYERTYLGLRDIKRFRSGAMVLVYVPKDGLDRSAIQYKNAGSG